jgi:hypothetical protein
MYLKSMPNSIWPFKPVFRVCGLNTAWFEHDEKTKPYEKEIFRNPHQLSRMHKARSRKPSVSWASKVVFFFPAAAGIFVTFFL